MPDRGPCATGWLHIDNAANVTCASIALGIASAALAAFRELGPRKRTSTGELLAESALGKMALAAAESGLARARGHLYETVELMWEEVAEGTCRDEQWFARTSLASVAVMLWVFVWAARKDGEDDRERQLRLGSRRRTRIGR